MAKSTARRAMLDQMIASGLLEHVAVGDAGTVPFTPTLGARATAQLDPLEVAIRTYRDASATIRAATAQKEGAEKILRAALENMGGAAIVTSLGTAELRIPSPVLAYILKPSECTDPSLLKLRQDGGRLVVTPAK